MERQSEAKPLLYNQSPFSFGGEILRESQSEAKPLLYNQFPAPPLKGKY